MTTQTKILPDYYLISCAEKFAESDIHKISNLISCYLNYIVLYNDYNQKQHREVIENKKVQLKQFVQNKQSEYFLNQCFLNDFPKKMVDFQVAGV